MNKNDHLPVEGSKRDQSLVRNSWSAPKIRIQTRSVFFPSSSTACKIEPAIPGTSNTGSKFGFTTYSCFCTILSQSSIARISSSNKAMSELRIFSRRGASNKAWTSKGSNIRRRKFGVEAPYFWWICFFPEGKQSDASSFGKGRSIVFFSLPNFLEKDKAKQGSGNWKISFMVKFRP